LTQFICGDERPKQFCPLFNGKTLLGHTILRAERNAPSPQVLFALTRTHREFYTPELDGFEHRRIVQPANKGTAPPIVFSALSIQARDEDAIVAFLPSDHHYTDDKGFQRALDSAFEIAARHPESVVLLGAQPNCLEVEYGWIELGAPVPKSQGEVHRVQAFREKPGLEIARELRNRGAVWNTFVMVGHVRAFIEMSSRAVPELIEALHPAALWSGAETHIDEAVYAAADSTDFSRRVLSTQTSKLVVFRIPDLGWSDLGHPGRVLAVAENSASKPKWLHGWLQRKGATSAKAVALGSATA
jgi:mannose-1-phosphate guanylyltransferase